MDNLTDTSNYAAIMGYSISGGSIVAFLCGLVVAISKYYWKSSCTVGNVAPESPSSPPGPPEVPGLKPAQPVEIIEDVLKVATDMTG